MLETQGKAETVKGASTTGKEAQPQLQSAGSGLQRIATGGDPLTPSDIMLIQRTAGNQVAARMVDAHRAQRLASSPGAPQETTNQQRSPILQAPPVSSTAPAIQRAKGLPDSKEFQKEAGSAGRHFGLGKSSFGQLLKQLDLYKQVDEADLEVQIRQLRSIKGLAYRWQSSKKRAKNKKGDDRKAVALKSLVGVVNQEIGDKIDKAIPREHKELSDIGKRSKYKNLRRLGGVTDVDLSRYKQEFISSGDFAKGQVFKELKNLNEHHTQLALKQSSATTASTEEEKNQLLGEAEQKKKDIASSEDRLKSNEIPIVDKNGQYTTDESQFDTFKVEYLALPEDRMEYRLIFYGGLIYQNREPFSTTKSTTWFSGTGTAIYVMDPDGGFYAGPHKIGRFHHSSFLAGGAIAGAGEMKAEQGKLIEISNKSGHYTPGDDEMYQVLQELDSQRVSLKEARLKLEPEGKYYPGGPERFMSEYKNGMVYH